MPALVDVQHIYDWFQFRSLRLAKRRFPPINGSYDRWYEPRYQLPNRKSI